MGQKVRGNLVIIGGAEDKTGDRAILKQVLKLAGGREAHIAVLTTATQDPELVGDKYARVFSDLGAEKVSVVNINTRSQAMNAQCVLALGEATGIFMTGGDQLRITSILGGTKAYMGIQRKYSEGIVIAGTSAGASVMSGAMIIGGEGDDSPSDRSVIIAPGLGLIEEVVVDQHFCQRGRLGRLLAVVGQNPYMIGLGIDENTAALVGENGELTVAGAGAVTVVDGSSIIHSNVTENDTSRTLALTNVTLSVLPSGYGYNLHTRQAIVPATDSKG